MRHAQNCKYQNVTPPAAIVNNAAYTTGEIDTLGYDYAEILAILGATDIAVTALKVQESDTSGSGFTDVTGLVFGTSDGIDGTTSSLPSATDDDGIFKFEIDLRYRKRYLDVSFTAGNGSTGTFATVLARLSMAKEMPDTAAEAGCVNVLRV